MHHFFDQLAIGRLDSRCTDASGSLGCGAFWSPRWFQVQWDSESMSSWPELGVDSITFKEMLPIVWALAIWGGYWKDSAVTVYCDNMGAVAAINSGYSKVPRIMYLLRCLFFIRARCRVDLIVSHIPGALNTLADAISRDNMSLVISQVPAASQAQYRLHPTMVSLLLDQRLDWLAPAWRESFEACFPPV